MKTRILSTLATMTWLLIGGPVFAQDSFRQPTWDRAMATEVIKNADTQTALHRLFRLARDGDNRSLQEALSAIVEDKSLPAPVADYLLFSFAIGLSDLDADSVSPEILRFLNSYQPRTLVPHDENAAAGAPLFNVQAAAAGIQNAWERQRAGNQALLLNNETPETWIRRYLAATPAGRRGFLDALADISPEQLEALGRAGAVRLQERPELTLLVAMTGVRSEDLYLVWQSIEYGQASDLPAVLRAVTGQLDSTECAELLHRSLGLDSTTAKALAIAQLGPASLNETRSQDALFNTLGSRELGAGAALVLSASSDPQVQHRLNEIAHKQDGLAGQRASLAINLRQVDEGAVQ